MKKYTAAALFVLLVLVLGACTQGSLQGGEAAIKPGDKIGDFLVTKGEKGVLYVFDYSRGCTDQGDGVTYSCKAQVGKNINITVGLYDDSGRNTAPTAKLEELWSSFDYKMWIEGRPVDLEAFGSIEANHPVVGVMRFWNVVITTEKPGQITVEDSGLVDGKPYEAVTTYIFSEP